MRNHIEIPMADAAGLLADFELLVTNLDRISSGFDEDTFPYALALYSLENGMLDRLAKMRTVLYKAFTDAEYDEISEAPQDYGKQPYGKTPDELKLLYAKAAEVLKWRPL